MRTTIDIDDPILQELKQLQSQNGKSLGRLISDLLAVSLSQIKEDPPRYVAPLDWVTADMSANIDLSDRDALLDAMDVDQHAGLPTDSMDSSAG